MRFKPLRPGDSLEMGRIYMTNLNHEVGPFDERDDPDAACFAWKIGEKEGKPVYACWWDTGVCANEEAEAYGPITAVEARTVEEAMQ